MACENLLVLQRVKPTAVYRAATTTSKHNADADKAVLKAAAFSHGPLVAACCGSAVACRLGLEVGGAPRRGGGALIPLYQYGYIHLLFSRDIRFGDSVVAFEIFLSDHCHFTGVRPVADVAG